MRTSDTIAAVSTPHGTGGMAVVRLSGPLARDVVQPMLSARLDEPRKAVYALFRSGGQVVDEIVATWFKAPSSYTGEDVVELSCHGSMYVQQTVLQCLVDSGARLAAPGEFTQRAFLNGKFNLSQAEAVADLIDSTNAAAHGLAISQLRGGYAGELKMLREQLVELTSLLELELDFSDEDVEFADRSLLRNLVDGIASKVASLRDSYRMGNAIRNGIPTAIAGRPNVGKSSLLNALLHEERAIVSPIPGTTRDTVEETLVVDGLPFRFIDTAGLRESGDMVEKIGVERSVAAIEKAQVVLLVHDITHPFDETRMLLDDIANRVDLRDKIIVTLLNKADLADSSTGAAIRVSAKTGEGIEALKEAMLVAVRERMPQGAMVANARHYEALGHLDEALANVAEGLKSALPADLVSVDLRGALHWFGVITGEVTSDEVLGSIFSRFCIGK